MNKPTTFDLRVPLTSKAHTIALQFAAEQVNPAKGKQVYFNTLAVIAVHKCLSWVGVESILASSETWHPGQRAIFDVADLFIPDLNKPRIECRPVLPNQDHVNIPPEVIENRLGCVAVQFYQQMNSVKMFGFKDFGESVAPGNRNIAIDDFDRFETIFDCLPKNIGNNKKSEDEAVNLFKIEFSSIWHRPEEFGFNKQAVADISSSQQAIVTKIDLQESGESANTISIFLMIEIRPQQENKIQHEVIISILPQSGEELHKNLKLSIKDEYGFYPEYEKVKIGTDRHFRRKITGIQSSDSFQIILQIDGEPKVKKFYCQE
jgi:Protein of unknown function (DUF1822)